jgi:uncharacterized protein (TIGR02147 family)
MRPNIFECSDYRDFLKKYYAYSKKTKQNFSHRYFSIKAGFTSPNVLLLVMNGKRNLSKDSIAPFAKAMELSKREQQYFETLVSFNQATNSEAKKYYLELLHNFRKEKTGKPIKDEQFAYISQWHYPVIRELVALPTFIEDPEWIKKQLRNKVTCKEVKEAIDGMLGLGLLKRETDGRLRQLDVHLITENEVFHTALYSVHQELLTLAKEVLAATKGPEREISGVTMAVSPKQFTEIKRMVHDFQDQVLRYLSNNEDMPQSVCQLNMQFFHITEDGNGGKNA